MLPFIDSVLAFQFLTGSEIIVILALCFIMLSALRLADLFKGLRDGINEFLKAT